MSTCNIIMGLACYVISHVDIIMLHVNITLCSHKKVAYEHDKDASRDNLSQMLGAEVRANIVLSSGI